MLARRHFVNRLSTLDLTSQSAEIYRITAAHEFPWDVFQALSFALFRTYAVPTIGELLAATGEFTEHTQRRYDDTVLLMDAVAEHGLGDAKAREALRRINAMHRAHGVGQEDLRYVLATFVVVPVRWIDDHGWRKLLPVEREACAGYYAELGRHMGITDIPADYAAFSTFMDCYERDHFAYSAGGRAVADATLELLTTLPLFRLLPASVVRRFAFALMDEPLLDALGYPHPRPAERLLARAGLRVRALVEGLLPARVSPYFFRTSPSVRSYPDGYTLAELGSFPGPGCPQAARSVSAI